MSHIEILTNPIYRGANLRIQLKSNCFIFNLCLLKTAIINCALSEHNNSTEINENILQTSVVFGPISDYLLIRNLKNIKISAICHRIFVDNCTNIILFVNTPNPVLLARNCRCIRLAPYNVFYNVNQLFNLFYNWEKLNSFLYKKGKKLILFF